MRIEETWTASSKSENLRKGEELINLAGQWGIGIEVRITNPYIYSQGSVQKRIIGKEMRGREILPLSNTPAQ